MKKDNNKIALGTAQFSNNYGITNKKKFSSNAIRNILEKSIELKIKTIDTAPNYKKVEKKLGENNLEKFQLITKTSLLKNNRIIDKFTLKNEINKSFSNLKVNKFYAILIRNPKFLLENKNLLEEILVFKKKNKVLKVGYTLYHPEELDILYGFFKPDIVQIPYSIVDNRFDKSKWIDKMYEDGLEIHIRSTFLQGLLLCDFKKLPVKFIKYEKFFESFENWLNLKKISKLQACLNLPLQDKRIKKIVVGISDLNNLEDINKITPIKLKYPKWLFANNEKLLDPSKW